MEIFLYSNLRFFREKYNLSQEQIADLIEKKKSVIGHYERGTSLPPLDSLIRISTFFGVTLDSLALEDLRAKDEIILKFHDLACIALSNSISEPEAVYESKETENLTMTKEERISLLKELLRKEKARRATLEQLLKKFTYLQSEIMKRFDEIYYSSKKPN